MKRTILVGALLFWCTILLGFRMSRADSLEYLFLPWNLLLASVPLAASTALLRVERRGGSLVIQSMLVAAWLLFLPNAPYILTDFIHLAPRPPIPLWFDLGMIMSAAGTGLILGYISVLDVHAVVARRFGTAAGWIVAVSALLLSGFGIYLGRFLRWNSWEVVTDPWGLWNEVSGRNLHPLAHPRAIGVTLMFGIGLTLGYAAIHALRNDERHRTERAS